MGLTTLSSLLIAQVIRPVSKQSRADSIIMDTIAITFYIMENEEKKAIAFSPLKLTGVTRKVY